MSFDDSGWWVGTLSPWPVASAYTLFSPDPSSRMDESLWSARAERFFASGLSIDPFKTYPAGTMPARDGCAVVVTHGRRRGVVRVRCFPLDEADDAMEAAVAAAAAMGGAGFDALLARAQRVWQVEAAEDGWEACTVMAVLSNVWLAPVLPPEAERLFGTKGARERLARHA